MFISMLAIFSASRIPSAFTAINKLSTKAIALVCFLNSKLRRELYWIFQNPGPQHDPRGSFTYFSFYLDGVRVYYCSSLAKVTFSAVVCFSGS